jgi:hypothetical protein
VSGEPVFVHPRVRSMRPTLASELKHNTGL